MEQAPWDVELLKSLHKMDMRWWWWIKKTLQLEKAKAGLDKILSRLCEKERITSEDKIAILNRIRFTSELKQLSDSDLVIEAIVENIGI